MCELQSTFSREQDIFGNCRVRSSDQISWSRENRFQVDSGISGDTISLKAYGLDCRLDYKHIVQIMSENNP